MKIILDEHTYHIDLTKTVELFRLLYLKVNKEGIALKNGEIIKIGDRSILRTSIKAMLTPVVIPFLQRMYKEQNIILDPPIKHSDLFDYCVNAFFDYISIMEKRFNVILASETIDNSSSTIKSILTTREEPLSIDSAPTNGTENDGR